MSYSKSKMVLIGWILTVSNSGSIITPFTAGLVWNGGKENPHRLAAQEPMGVTNSSVPITGRATERYQERTYHD